MIRSLRLYFLGRALREKLLLLVFIGIGLLWWSSAYAKRGAQFWREQRLTTSRLNEQAMWINNRGLIETRAQETAAQFDRAKTLNANQLAAVVDQMASQAGLRDKAASRGLNTTTSGQFAIHALDYQISGAEWDRVKSFYQALQGRAPYIAIDTFRLNAQTNNPTQLVLLLRVISVEIVR
jgi:hypothetical protein